jgi:hypothetical protein
MAFQLQLQVDLFDLLVEVSGTFIQKVFVINLMLLLFVILF